ncbi:matrixin family metalloprotease [Psychroserpens damuponensis]|uniref:matrixin family metalloprotease n=1 Tax=Psychroserpens damuponensis TaxID=943936 RepID=UPI00069323B7|nr:matrixin family metalloprotease [Psychroserpens damuponensis]
MKKFVALLLLSIVFSCSKRTIKIGIQPYGDIDTTILSSISEILKTSYQADVYILDKTELPKTAFTNIKSPRYRADSLLIDLKSHIPDSIDYILGITSKDISTTKRITDGSIKKPESKYQDWGIFGLGYKPGQSCVVSTFRIKHVKTSLFKSRLQKIAVHEIGHNLGLDHCDTKKCVMQDAVESINTVDLANFKLCNRCLDKI